MILLRIDGCCTALVGALRNCHLLKCKFLYRCATPQVYKQINTCLCFTATPLLPLLILWYSIRFISVTSVTHQVYAIVVVAAVCNFACIRMYIYRFFASL
jgi:hypothetical protein